MTLEARRMLVAFMSGLLFSVGLAVAGMTDPSKVLAFLDLFGGEWDPSLMFVMIGAIGVYAPAYMLLKKRGKPQLDDRFHVPTLQTIDGKLLLGSVLFGIGWGLSGLCPGPMVVSSVSGSPMLLLAAAAMVAGMLAHYGIGTVVGGVPVHVQRNPSSSTTESWSPSLRSNTASTN